MAILRGLATNPIILALGAGILFNCAGLTMPKTLEAIAKPLGGAAIPCALFALGASMTRYKISGSLPEPLVLVAFKTPMHPAIVWVLGTQVFELPKLWAAVAITLAALPAGVTGYLYAQRYQICVATSATTILLSTGLSALTLSALVYLLVSF